jgi:SAM-dependent methyltransferase
MWLYLQEKTDFLKRPHRVLHIAPEHCFIKRLEKIHGSGYVTADIESPLAKVKMDIHQMPFGDHDFDVVLCNHVLEHVADDLQALREIHRVLKPGGWALLQVPFFPPVPEVTFQDLTITDKRERERLFGQDDHVRRYGNDYAARINSAGLRCEPDLFAATVPVKYGVHPAEVLYIARKS